MGQAVADQGEAAQDQEHPEDRTKDRDQGAGNERPLDEPVTEYFSNSHGADYLVQKNKMIVT